MSIKEQITEQMKVAMRNKDSVTLDALRGIKTAIANKEVAGAKRIELDDAGCIGVIRSLIKQLQESLAEAGAAGRNDLADKAKAELAVLEKFLPAQMTAEAIESAVQTTIKELNASSIKDMGKVMKEFNAKFGGKADGKTVSEIVKKCLETNSNS